MKTTVIIPTWNRAALIPFAIQSVLSQNYKDYELLILDDASTDNTQEIVSQFLSDHRVRYIKHPQNIGITANRNYGLSIAEGEYIAMLDSDDVWLSPLKLQKQIDFLNRNQNHAVVGTFARKIDGGGNIVPLRPIEKFSNLFLASTDKWMRRNFSFRNQLIHSSVLIRKEAIKNQGVYDENIPIWEDYELWLRLGTKYKFANIPEFMTGYRVHEQNITKENREKGLEATLRILKLNRKKYPNYYLGQTKYVLKKTFKKL